jgi:hypothetical protein
MSVRLRAVGGRGGNAFVQTGILPIAGSHGGAGADARASVDVSGVHTLYAEVGSDGARNNPLLPLPADGGVGGGGAGGVAIFGGAGGGGASDVRLCPGDGSGCNSLASRILVGAGGGGAAAGADVNGGNGGLPNGADGDTPAGLTVAHGATVSAPGAGAVYPLIPLDLSGAFGRGANGTGGSRFGAGGGGGGYYGGAGGDGDVDAGAGGGGSSFAVYGAYDISYVTATDEPLVSITYSGVDVPAITGSPRVGTTLHVSWPGHETGATYRWEWCASPTDCAAIAGATTADYRILSFPGAYRLRAVVTSSDGTVAGTSAQTPFVLRADTTPPTVALTSPADGATYSVGATILASYSCTDEDGGSGLATCAGTVGNGHAIDTRAAGDYTFAVTATDAAGNTTTRTAYYTVAGGAPRVASPPTVAGRAQDGQLLTADPGNWSGAQPLVLTYRWQRCDSSGATCRGIAGAASADYRLRPADIGSTIRVVVTGKNGAGATAAPSAPTAVVVAAPPVNATAPALTARFASRRVVLQATRGDWDGSPTLAYAYQWQRCDAAGESCTDVPGATTRSYSVPTGQNGTLRVAVTASNAAGRATALSAPVATNP